MSQLRAHIASLAEGIRVGNRRALAKAITLVESTRIEDQEAAQQLFSLLGTPAKESVRLGISGVPGAGKSTFIEALGMHLIAQGLQVAVLAVDPSSPSSGGSILGDKTRMQELASRSEAFIRPSPTGGNLGGVARTTRETMRLCEHAGCDVLLIETVGVGQSEYEVASMVDCFLLLMIAGAGDGLQGIKRGILELVDIMVINKADGDNLERAKRARAEYETALHLLRPKHQGHQAPVLLASALHGNGIADVWKEVSSIVENLKEAGLFHRQRQHQQVAWMHQLIETALRQQFWSHPDVKRLKPQLIKQLDEGEITAFSAAQTLLDAAHQPTTVLP